MRSVQAIYHTHETKHLGRRDSPIHSAGGSRHELLRWEPVWAAFHSRQLTLQNMLALGSGLEMAGGRQGNPCRVDVVRRWLSAGFDWRQIGARMPSVSRLQTKKLCRP